MNNTQTRQIRTYQINNCLLCGSEGEVLYSGLEDTLFGVQGKWGLKKCLNPECELIWIDPMPIPEDINMTYQNYYTHLENNGSFNQRNLMGSLLNRSYAFTNRIVSSIFQLNELHRQFDSLFLCDIGKGKVLDIGCGKGEFLFKMRCLGWEVEGVDFDPLAAEYCYVKYGIKVHVNNVEGVNYSNNFFDAIVMKHVIEHVLDPISLIRECRRILKPGGRLVIITPNINSFGHHRFKNNWRGLEPPRHLHLFSHKSLLECTSRSGLQISNIITNPINSKWTFEDSLVIEAKFKQKEVNTLHKLLYKLKSLFFQYYEIFLSRNTTDLGEELVMICTKI